MKGLPFDGNIEVDVATSNQLSGIQYANPTVISTDTCQTPSQFICVTALLFLTSNSHSLWTINVEHRPVIR